MALSKLAVRRLTKLAEFMAKLPASANKHFDMGMWFEHEGDHNHEFGRTLSRDDLKHCGTTACALGWGATMPYFKKLGLTVDPSLGSLRFRGRASIDPMLIAAQVVNITVSEAVDLFGGHLDAVKTPKQWARHCRKFIKENA
jgi:hypothetical protein